MRLTINGVSRDFENMGDSATITELVASLGFRPDRVALEQNGEIVPRTRWPEAPVREGDRIELVHFVGGGAPVARFADVSSCRSRSHWLP